MNHIAQLGRLAAQQAMKSAMDYPNNPGAGGPHMDFKSQRIDQKPFSRKPYSASSDRHSDRYKGRFNPDEYDVTRFDDQGNQQGPSTPWSIASPAEKDQQFDPRQFRPSLLDRTAAHIGAESRGDIDWNNIPDSLQRGRLTIGQSGRTGGRPSINPEGMQRLTQDILARRAKHDD